MEFRIDWSGKSFNYSDEEINSVVEVMKNADPLTKGSYLKKFENDFRDYIGAGHCLGVSSCSASLELAASLCRLGPDDEVIIPGHTYCASAIPFGRTGAKLVWADIDAETLVIDAEDVKKKITPKTKVLVVVHLYGNVADMDAMCAIAKENNLVLVEDCAQSMGASYKGRKVGSIGDFGCFSFHAQKNLTTLGEGGMLAVKDEEKAKLATSIRHNGHAPFDFERENYWQPAMSNVDMAIDGFWPSNYPLCEAQAALGSAILKRIDDMNSERKRRFVKFVTELADYPELIFPSFREYTEGAYHLLPAKYDGSKYGKTNHDLIAKLAYDNGIKAIVQYYPLYRYDLFKKLGFGKADCPATDEFYDNMVSFPFHLWMEESDFDYMIQSTIKSLNELRG